MSLDGADEIRSRNRRSSCVRKVPPVPREGLDGTDTLLEGGRKAGGSEELIR